MVHQNEDGPFSSDTSSTKHADEAGARREEQDFHLARGQFAPKIDGSIEQAGANFLMWCLQVVVLIIPVALSWLAGLIFSSLSLLETFGKVLQTLCAALGGYTACAITLYFGAGDYWAETDKALREPFISVQQLSLPFGSFYTTMIR